MLKCSACGTELPVRIIDVTRYHSICPRCGLEHSLSKKRPSVQETEWSF